MRKKLLLIIALGLLIALIFLGWHYYKIFSFKSELKPLALQDNQLMQELIDLTAALPNIDLDSLAQKVQSNKAKRLALMNKIRWLKPYIYKQQLKLYLRLLELENNYADSLRQLKQALNTAQAAESGDMVKETVVEEIRHVGKKSIAYRKKVFSSDLTKFRGVMDARLSAINKHLEVMRQLINHELTNAEALNRIVPKRNLMNQLEKANDQIK